MRRKLREHLLSVVVVATAFGILIIRLHQQEADRRVVQHPAVEEALALRFLDFGDPLDRALYKESLDAFSPDARDRHAALLEKILDARRQQFTNELYKTGTEQRGITGQKLQRVLGMYLQFIVVYVVVMAISVYASETLGTLRFVRMKQGKSSSLGQLADALRDRTMSGSRRCLRALGHLAVACGNGVLSMVLFSPAYVIAYSFKTRFDTDSVFFMIVLGIISNGLLVNYAHKFYTFLVAESRKGYVETALVKNLNHSYSTHNPDGIRLADIFRIRKTFPGHVFQHIYLNAHHQYLPALKEHASFLISGLVIIEMALNIQGHLNYEMLKNILYKQYDVVLLIVFAIYLLVKGTEVFVDTVVEREARRLENRA